MKALQRNAHIDTDNVSLSTAEGTITLRGTVTSWPEWSAGRGGGLGRTRRH